MLKYKTVNIVSCQDWDNLVEKTYGKIYCLQQQDGGKDRGLETFTVPMEDPFDYNLSIEQFDVNGINMGVNFSTWKNHNGKFCGMNSFNNKLLMYRNFYPSLEVLAQDLYEQGLIPAGEYVIQIDW